MTEENLKWPGEVEVRVYYRAGQESRYALGRLFGEDGNGIHMKRSVDGQRIWFPMANVEKIEEELQ